MADVRRFMMFLLAGLWLLASLPAFARNGPTPIRVETPEVYELANVILAITDYGQADPLEVQKGTPYHAEVMAHFGRFRGHALIRAVNYSRAQWEDYLGFRSDAYAFAFDRGGRLRRTSTFQATTRRPFDAQLALVEDFARVSGFRAFYRARAGFFRTLRELYAASYLLDDSRAFLEREFGREHSGEYRAILSPLVGRMNAQRVLGQAQLGFVNVARGLLTDGGTGALSERERLTEFHTLFTEMDHLYVNPVSAGHAALIARQFDPARWNRGDGYGSALDTFNEYMTWALYDLLARERFGAAAETSIANWHYINKGRGFIASELFAEKLAQLYRDRPPGTRIRDLYPALLAWTAQRQAALSPPTLEPLAAPIQAAPMGRPTRVTLRFSEPMRPMARMSVSQFVWRDGRYRFTRDVEIAGLVWSADGRALSFDYAVPDAERSALSFNLEDNTPLTGLSGLYLHLNSRIEFVRAAAG